MPQIYWITKLHKTPYKARFIAGSTSCTTTRHSKLLTQCLKQVCTHCTTYCKTIRVRTGVNCVWIINNSLDVIRALEEKQLSKSCEYLGFFRLFIPAFHTPNLTSNSMIFWKEFLLLKERASLLPIIFTPSGRMIGCRGTRTSPVQSFVSLLTFLSTTSTFVLEALFSGRLLV